MIGIKYLLSSNNLSTSLLCSILRNLAFCAFIWSNLLAPIKYYRWGKGRGEEERTKRDRKKRRRNKGEKEIPFHFSHFVHHLPGIGIILCLSLRLLLGLHVQQVLIRLQHIHSLLDSSLQQILCYIVIDFPIMFCRGFFFTFSLCLCLSSSASKCISSLVCSSSNCLCLFASTSADN